MALDFIIKNNKDYPIQYLPVGMKVHEEIVNSARMNALPMFSRINEYFADSFYDIDELGTFLTEINKLMGKMADNKEAFDFLVELKKMTESAQKQGKGIRVRSD